MRPEWKLSNTPVPYLQAVAFMEQRVEAIRSQNAPELVWCLEHPPLYTLGTGGKTQDILRPDVPTFETGRGGQATFHGPGQRVVYVLMDLSQRGQDLRAHIWRLEEWLRRVLEAVGIQAVRRPGRVGLWVTESPFLAPSPLLKESKVAALGVRVRRWVTYHGCALNVCPDLGYFDGIVPCGLPQYGVTSLEALGVKTTLPEIDQLLQEHFAPVFEEK